MGFAETNQFPNMNTNHNLSSTDFFKKYKKRFKGKTIIAEKLQLHEEEVRKYFLLKDKVFNTDNLMKIWLGICESGKLILFYTTHEHTVEHRTAKLICKIQWLNVGWDTGSPGLLESMPTDLSTSGYLDDPRKIVKRKLEESLMRLVFN